MTTEPVFEPQWIDNALVVRCSKCRANPGAKYGDMSGLCEGCKGAAYKVLATRAAVPAERTEENDG